MEWFPLFFHNHTRLQGVWCLLHGVVTCDATRGSVFAVVTVLQVKFRFSDQIVGAHQVPVIYRHSECGIHRERGLHVKRSDTMTNTAFVRFACTFKHGRNFVAYKRRSNDRFWIEYLYLLAKQGVQLFWDVVLFVFDLCLSQFDCNVWISFSINVSWMQISCLPKKKRIQERNGWSPWDVNNELLLYDVTEVFYLHYNPKYYIYSYIPNLVIPCKYILLLEMILAKVCTLWVPFGLPFYGLYSVLIQFKCRDYLFCCVLGGGFNILFSNLVLYNDNNKSMNPGSAELTAYPDNVDADEDINGIVVRNVLKHSHGGLEAHVSLHFIRHFVHAQGALQGIGKTKWFPNM